VDTKHHTSAEYEGLTDDLTSKRVIDFDDKIKIQQRGANGEPSPMNRFISKLIAEMRAGDNKKFSRLVELMKKSPKCASLVNRMQLLVSQHQPLIEAAIIQPAIGNYM